MLIHWEVGIVHEGENNSDKDAAERDDMQEASTSAYARQDPASIEDDHYIIGKGTRAKSSLKRPEAKMKSNKQRVSKSDNSLSTVIQQQEDDTIYSSVQPENLANFNCKVRRNDEE